MLTASADDHELAATLARQAGQLLVELRRSGLEGDELKNRGDRLSDDLLVPALRKARPEDGLLSEESIDDPSRLERRRVWIVDPLDGTREYGEKGRWDWAVHVGLAIDGHAVAGAVALPERDLVLSTAAPSTLPPPTDPPRVVVSRSRPPRLAVQVAEILGAELVELGSAGAKTMAVVLGDADIYLHAGGQYEWDNCAPAAVAAAAGLHTSRIDGSPLRYNNADPSLPDLLVCRAELADATLAAIRRCA